MSLDYFNKLNYTLANEDTSLELGLFPQDMGHLMSVTGSGGRILPLLARSPRKVSCVDVSQEQLYLAELRFESLRALDHEEFLKFWGYPPKPAEPEERRKLFNRIPLSPAAESFLRPIFENTCWNSILYAGRWERTVGKLAKVNRRITGQKGIGLFSALNRAEHFEYLRDQFPSRSWAVTLTLLGNAGVFNSLLYKGHFPKKNLPGSSFRHYHGAFDRLFAQGPARENYFLQLFFFGRILFAEGCPIECDPKVYAQARKGLEGATIQYLCGNIVEEAEKSSTPIDALSLSDVPSYFSGETERQFLQRIRRGMNPGGTVVIRNYLRAPENTDRSGFEDVTHLHEDLIRDEKTQMYRVDVLRRTSW